jgi:hypothetical protein
LLKKKWGWKQEKKMKLKKNKKNWIKKKGFINGGAP